MSNSSSSNSLNLTSGSLHGGKTGLTMPRSRQSSVTSSQENLLDRKSTLTRKNSGIPTFASPPKTADASLTNGSPRHSQSPMAARSNSAIDPSAVRRANVRAQYANRNRMGVTVGASLPRPGRKNSGTPLTTPDSARSGRSRSRIGSASGVGASGALSQPGSRSTSPSSIKSYHTYFEAAGGQIPKSSPRKR